MDKDVKNYKADFSKLLNSYTDVKVQMALAAAYECGKQAQIVASMKPCRNDCDAAPDEA